MFATRNLHAPIVDVPPAASHDRSVADAFEAALSNPNLAANESELHTQSNAGPETENPPRLTVASMASDDLTGHAIGQYALGRKLGAGGMGRVFFARHKLLNRLFAIKFIAENVACFTAATQRFDQEIAALGKLQHSNIVNAVDAGCLNGMKYLVTELVVGTDLGTLTWRHGKIPIAMAAELIRQAAVGLSYSHRQGFLHRDIKPSNLILDESGTVKLLDFGLVRNAAVDQQLTANGDMLGTLDFVAPEQAHDASSVDERSDIYSLGCTLLFLLTGNAPFNCERYSTAASKLKGHLFDEPDALARPPASWPEDLVHILSRMLAKSPSERFQTAAEVAAALASLATTAELAPLHNDGPLTCEHDQIAKLRSALGSAAGDQPAHEHAIVGYMLVAAVCFVVIASTLSLYLEHPESIATPIASANASKQVVALSSVSPLTDTASPTAPHSADRSPPPTSSHVPEFAGTEQQRLDGEEPAEPAPVGESLPDDGTSNTDPSVAEINTDTPVGKPDEELATPAEPEASPLPEASPESVQPAEPRATPQTKEPASTLSARPIQFKRGFGFPDGIQPSVGKTRGDKEVRE